MEMSLASMDYLLRTEADVFLLGNADLSSGAESLRLEADKIIFISESGAETTLTLLTFGETPAGDGWYLRCESPEEGQNRVLRMFHGFQRWRSELLGYVGKEDDIQSVIECASRYLGLPMSFVDSEYRFLGVSSNQPPVFRAYYDMNQMSVVQVKELFENNPAFMDTFLGQELKYYPRTGTTGDPAQEGTYYCNVLVDQKYAGRILIPHGVEPLDRGVPELIEQLMDVLHSCCVLRRYRNVDRQPHEVWREMLETGKVDVVAATNMLQTLRWQVKQRYQVLCLRPLGYLYDAQTMKYLAIELEKIFTQCIVVYRDGSLICLHNLSLEENEDFQGRFSLFLRENLFLCGVSNEFDDFFDSRSFSKQAGEALTLGERRDPSMWRYEYADYLYEAVLLHAAGGYPVDELCSPALRKLLAYETEHPESRLTETLYEYIACRFNAVQAAERMHMHRTTFIHHIQKIQQVAEFHLEDPREHLTVFLALSSLRELPFRIEDSSISEKKNKYLFSDVLH